MWRREAPQPTASQPLEARPPGWPVVDHRCRRKHIAETRKTTQLTCKCRGKSKWLLCESQKHGLRWREDVGSVWCPIRSCHQTPPPTPAPHVPEGHQGLFQSLVANMNLASYYLPGNSFNVYVNQCLSLTATCEKCIIIIELIWQTETLVEKRRNLPKLQSLINVQPRFGTQEV